MEQSDFMLNSFTVSDRINGIEYYFFLSLTRRRCVNMIFLFISSIQIYVYFAHGIFPINVRRVYAIKSTLITDNLYVPRTLNFTRTFEYSIV